MDGEVSTKVRSTEKPGKTTEPCHVGRYSPGRRVRRGAPGERGDDGGGSRPTISVCQDHRQAHESVPPPTPLAWPRTIPSGTLSIAFSYKMYKPPSAPEPVRLLQYALAPPPNLPRTGPSSCSSTDSTGLRNRPQALGQRRPPHRHHDRHGTMGSGKSPAVCWARRGRPHPRSSTSAAHRGAPAPGVPRGGQPAATAWRVVAYLVCRRRRYVPPPSPPLISMCHDRGAFHNPFVWGAGWGRGGERKSALPPLPPPLTLFKTKKRSFFKRATPTWTPLPPREGCRGATGAGPRWR